MRRYIATEISPTSLPEKLRIITPTKAIANYLKAPHYSLESLGQNIVRQQGWGIASALLSRRLLQDAVREIIDTPDIVGTTRVFLPTIRELFHSGIDLTVLPRSSSRIEQLANLALFYQQQLRRQNLLDPAEVFWHCREDRRFTYLFYGYFMPARDELAFIDAVAGDGSILVLSDADEAIAWLRQRGWEAKFNSTKDPSKKKMALHVYPDLDAEVRGVLTQIKVLLSEGVKAKDIAIVAREEQLYGETLIDVAWEYKLKVRVWYEVPLEVTRIGAWLKLLIEAIETEFAFEATAKLLANPLVKRMSAEVWEKARTTHPQGLAAWQELGVDLSLLKFPTASSRRDWIERWQEILADWQILENSGCWAREIIAFYRLREALIDLGKPEAEQIGKKTFFRELEETLALLCVPAQPGRGGVELHAPTSLFGTKYQYVFVLGMAEGMMPPTLADDPVLDFYDRAQLARQEIKINTAVEIATREAFICSSLLAIPERKIIFSYPQAIANTSILPSPYLTRWDLQPEPLPSLPLPSIEAARRSYLRAGQLEDLLLPQITAAWQVELNRELQPTPDEYDGVIGMAIAPEKRILSASQLTQLGQCPFKWFATRLLKLRELAEPETDLNAAFRGNLYHRCLELTLENIATATDLEKFNREQLERAFTQAERELELTELPGWEIQRQEHLELLALNLITPEFLPADREVIATETEFETTWHDLQVRGKVDRIDRTTKGLTVIDYKTSGSKPAGVKDATGKANLDIQLALYSEAIETIYPDATVSDTAYYSLTKRQFLGRSKTTPEQLAAFAERVKIYLERGYYPVAPDVDNKACNYCPFDLVCRKGDRLSRKQHLSFEG